MALWEEAKRLSRNPFARILTGLSEAEDPESYQGSRKEPETFSEWFLLSVEDDPPLFEGNPYVDRIENDPILVLCAGMTSDEEPPKPSKVKRPMGWEEYVRRQSESRRKKRKDPEGDPMTDVETELKTIREQLRKALLVPKGDFPLPPALEELIRERNEARAERSTNELEIVRLEKELQKSQAREKFLSLCIKVGEPPPCRNCGRIVLAGPPCCEKPDIPEIQPVGVPLEEYDKVVEQLESLRDLLSEYVVGSGGGKDDQDWIREMFVRGFVPSISNTKTRRERDKAQNEAQQWHDLVFRLRTHLDIPHDATYQDAPRLAREALHKAQVQGARWMQTAFVEALIASPPRSEPSTATDQVYGSVPKGFLAKEAPAEVCEAHRPKEDPPFVNSTSTLKGLQRKCPPHRFALRQTTGKETCIDCFVEENLGVNRAARRKSARAKRKKV